MRVYPACTTSSRKRCQGVCRSSFGCQTPQESGAVPSCVGMCEPSEKSGYCSGQTESVGSRGPWTSVHVYLRVWLRHTGTAIPAWRSHAPMVDVEFSPRIVDDPA